MIRLYKTDILYKFDGEPKVSKKKGSRNKIDIALKPQHFKSPEHFRDFLELITGEKLSDNMFKSFRKEWLAKEFARIILSVLTFSSGAIITFAKKASSPSRNKYFNVSVSSSGNRVILAYNGKSGSLPDVILRLVEDGANSLYAVKCLENIESFKLEDNYIKDRRKNTIMSFANTMKGANGYYGVVHITNKVDVLRFDGNKSYHFGEKLIAKNEDEFIDWALENITKFQFPLEGYGYRYNKELSNLNKRIKLLERVGFEFSFTAVIEPRKNASVSQQNEFISSLSKNQSWESTKFMTINYFSPRNLRRKRMFVYNASQGYLRSFLQKVKRYQDMSFLNKKTVFIYTILI